MASSPQRRRPSFFWQALLIVCPVAVLAAVGFLSLRRDKMLAQHEAIDRAQVIADQLLPSLWSALTNADKPEAFEHHAFQIDAAGEVLFPPSIASTPSPEPLNPGELNAEQANLWHTAERAEVSDKDNPTAIQAIQAFLETKPPDRFAAVATYSLARKTGPTTGCRGHIALASGQISACCGGKRTTARSVGRIQTDGTLGDSDESSAGKSSYLSRVFPLHNHP